MADRNGKVLTAEDIMQMQVEIAKRKAEKLEQEKIKKIEEENKRKEAQAAREADRIAIQEMNKEASSAAKKGKGSSSPFSKDNVKATRQEMASTVKNKMKWFVLGNELGKPKDDNEVLHRINEFWKLVSESGEVPQKTDLFMFMNIGETTYLAWKNGQGCSRERMEMIQQVEYLFMSVVDNTALHGDISQIPYIWQTKQWFGYKEPKAEMEITNHNPMQMFPDSTAVEQKYLDLISGDTEVDPKYLSNVEVEENE